MDEWQWQGQPRADWPAWLVFKNAANTDRRITIHQIDGPVRAELGDWIVRGPDGHLTIRKPEPSWDERHFRELRDSF